MRYHRCKCGKQEAWESGFPPAPCEVCDECGSTLAESPSSHRKPKPHDWQDKWVIRDEKPMQIRRCRRCFKEEPTEAALKGETR